MTRVGGSETHRHVPCTQPQTRTQTQTYALCLGTHGPLGVLAVRQEPKDLLLQAMASSLGFLVNGQSDNPTKPGPVPSDA